MDRAEYLKQFKTITDRMLAITESKNSDYGEVNDALSNFTFVEKVRSSITAADGIHVRMCDKLMRFSHLLDRVGAVEDESIEDTLLDLANYSIICVILLRSLRVPKDSVGSVCQCMTYDLKACILPNGHDGMHTSGGAIY